MANLQGYFVDAKHGKRRTVWKLWKHHGQQGIGQRVRIAQFAGEKEARMFLADSGIASPQAVDELLKDLGPPPSDKSLGPAPENKAATPPKP